MINYGPRLIWGEFVNLSFGFFLSINATLLFIVIRVAWITLRPNNSFKPNPHQGGA